MEEHNNSKDWQQVAIDESFYKQERDDILKENEGYSPLRMKRFMYHLAKACKKHHIRIMARNNLYNQIDKIKKVSASKPKKKQLEKELFELKEKLNDYLAEEGTLPSKHPGNIGLAVKKRIAELEKKLDQYSQISIERHKRITELEKRIKKEADYDEEEAEKLETQIELLRSKYEALKKSGKHNPEKLAIVKKRIEDSVSSLKRQKINKRNKK